MSETEYGGDTVVFKLKRPWEAEPFDELVVSTEGRKRVKPNYQSSVLAAFENMSLQDKMALFLSRVDIPKNDISQRSIRNIKSMHAQQREKTLLKLRGLEHAEVVDLSARNTVEFGGVSFQCENLGDFTQDYYVLRRGNLRTSNPPTINLPQSVIDRVLKESDESQYDSSDSNREDHPDYDYPEEGYSESSDEGLIPGTEQYGHFASDDEAEDAEQAYRRYLRRCRRKELQMDVESEVRDEEI